MSLNKYVISTENIFISKSTKGENQVFKIYVYKNFRHWIIILSNVSHKIYVAPNLLQYKFCHTLNTVLTVTAIAESPWTSQI